MMEEYMFREVSLCEVGWLRDLQTHDLKGQIYDPLDEHITVTQPICLQIRYADDTIGYALLDDKDERGVTLLEWYLVLAHRNNATHVLNTLIHDYRCCWWFVSSQDAFALPLMLENGFTYKLDGLIFSVDSQPCLNEQQQDTCRIQQAQLEDLQSIFSVVMQDGFYTGGGLASLTARIRNEEIYLLRSQQALIGVGFVCSLARTPRYADIAMIIDQSYRQKGFATELVQQLVRISFTKGLIPTALTSPTNTASKRTLERCGFYVDGCMLLANLQEKAR